LENDVTVYIKIPGRRKVGGIAGRTLLAGGIINRRRNFLIETIL